MEWRCIAQTRSGGGGSPRIPKPHIPFNSTGKCPFWTRRSKCWNTEYTGTDIVHSEATGILLRFAISKAHIKYVSATMALTGGLSWPRSLSTGASILVKTSWKKAGNFPARALSEVSTFGMVPKLMLWGFGSEPIKPSHSSVTTNVIRISCLFEASDLQRFIMGFIWPRPGYDKAITWQMVVASRFPRWSISSKQEIDCFEPWS